MNKRGFCILGLVLLGLVLLGLSPLGAAGFQKCPDGAGSWTYQDRACPAVARAAPAPVPEGPRPPDSIDRFCTRQWPDDPRMQKACYRAQHRAALDISRHFRTLASGSRAQAMAVNCAERWQLGPDQWDMVQALACTERALMDLRARRNLVVLKALER